MHEISGPAHGTLTLDGETGAYTYTPHANYFGNDSFSYEVVDRVQGFVQRPGVFSSSFRHLRLAASTPLD